MALEEGDLTRTVALQEMAEVWGSTNPMAKAKESENSKRPSPLQEEAEPSERREKWNKPAYGRPGKGQSWGGWNKWDSQGSQAEAGTMDQATLHLLRTLVKTTMRLDEDVSRLRADCNFMLFIDTVTETNTLQKLRAVAQQWQDSFTAGKEAVESVQQDDAIKDRLLRVGWIEDGINALLPAWHYYRWDPQAQRQDRLLRCLDTLEKGCCVPNTLLRFRSTHKPGQETQADVLPFMLSISLRGSVATECHEALCTVAYSGALKVLGLRLRTERAQQSQMARELGEAYLSVPLTDWSRRRAQWTPAQQQPKPPASSMET
ncbi:unnamed protein product [Symbiodinium sp. CCMP2456]|nr:unnamed protein product [Symbiodinium sp. CCMP2456]